MGTVFVPVSDTMRLINTTSGLWYQVDISPTKPKLLMWRGKGIMANKFGHPARIQEQWDEIAIRSLCVPEKLGEPMTYVTNGRCHVTSAPVFGIEKIDKFNRRFVPIGFTIKEAVLQMAHKSMLMAAVSIN